jgi:DNA gyrase subunit A
VVTQPTYGEPQPDLNGDLAESATRHTAQSDGLPPPPYGIAMTSGGKVLRFALSQFAQVSTKKGRIVVRLDASVQGDVVVGVEATDGSETICLATRSARVLIFPISEANVVSGPAKGVTAIKLDPKDRVLGFALANRVREGLTVETNRGASMIVRATKYPVTSRGGRGYGVLQRGSFEKIMHDEAQPVPPVDQVGEQ